MNHFWRAIRNALRYRWTVAGIILSSAAIALLWGANLSTVYPIVDVVLKDRSLRNWVDDNLAETEASLISYQADLDRLRRVQAVSPIETRRNRMEIARVEARMAADRAAKRRAAALRPWIYRFTPKRPFETLLAVVVLLLVGTVAKSIFVVVNVVLVQRVSQLVAYDLRKQLHRNALRLSLSQFGSGKTPRLLSHFTHDMECLSAGVKTVYGRALREPLKIVACLLGAAFICWQLLVLSLIVTPIAIALINRLAKFVKRAGRRSLEEMSLMFERLSETLSHVQLVKAFTRERYERGRFHRSARDYFRRCMQVAFFDAISKPCNELMGIGVIGLALLTGGYLVLNQETHLWGIQMCQRPMNFGALMTFFALLAGVSDPFRKLADVYSELQKGAAAADRIYDIIDQEPAVPNPAQPKPLSRPLKSLRFDQVDFEYAKDNLVLKGINLEIHQGETVAILGPNGCGKSTLTSLIPRFHDPQRGQVLWNETDLRELRKSDLRRQIGIVSQHAMLLNDTILANIQYGAQHAAEEDVYKAARQAGAHQFITHLREGYDTPVGPNGFALSGGQRQRVALARAILRRPELLILDEATSQIDLESERSIRRALLDYCSRRTAILITHRPETLEIADRVVVMEAGSISCQGTHEELLGQSALYRGLYQNSARISA